MMTNDVARKCIYTISGFKKWKLTHPECKKEYKIATIIMERHFDLKYIYRYRNTVEVCRENYGWLKLK